MMHISPTNPRSVLSFSLALLTLFMFAFPTPAGASGNTATHEVSIAVLYDESYAALIENELSLDPEERIDQIVRFASRSFEDTYDIEFTYTILSYEDTIGTPYSADISFPGYCDDLWSWNVISTTPTIEVEREWNHFDGECHCILKNSNCCVANTPGHHTSGTRVLWDLRDSNLAAQYDILVCFVGYEMCFYRYSDSTHRKCVGLSLAYDDVSAVSGSYHWPETHHLYPNDVSVYRTSNFLSSVHVLQHELSHDFGTHDENCTSNYPCIMSSGFTGIVFANNIWCDQCGTQDFDADKYD